jgi:FkbM family methyltransferase
VGEDDLIFDVGMHLGEDTDLYLKMGYRVVAFEANPEFVRRCRGRFADAISTGRLRIVEGAISPQQRDRIPFFVNETETQWGTTKAEWVSRNQQRGAPSRQIVVARTDPASMFREYGTPYYLKVDIEGSDREVIEALLTSPERPRYVSIETDITSYRSALSEISLLHRAGYRKFRPVQQKMIENSRVGVRVRDGSVFEHRFERGASGLFGEHLPGEWLSFQECRRAYRWIFLRYYCSGHKSPFFGHPATKAIEKVIGRAGWHDLHATTG